MAAGRYAGAEAAFALTTGRMRWAPVAASRISHRRISNRRPLCERAGHLSTDTACPALTDRHRSVGPVATPRIAQHKTKPNHQDRYLGASGGTVQTPTGTSALTIGMWPMAATRISQQTWYLKAVWSTLAF